MATSSAIKMRPQYTKLRTLSGTNDNDESYILPEAAKPTIVGLPMRLISPRIEAASNAYFKHAHPSALYRVKIAVQGGKPPFRYTIVSGPNGAVFDTGTREQQFSFARDSATGKVTVVKPATIGILEWQPNAGMIGTTFLFRVKVEDQDRKVIYATWECTVSETAFLVFDSVNGNDANPGTWTSPMASFSNYATMATGKIGLFKNGTYTVTGPASYLTDSASRMKTFIGVGNNVVFDMTTVQFGAATNSTDVGFVNIEFNGCMVANTTIHIFDFGGRLVRGVWFLCRWKNVNATGNTANNPACIFIADIAGTIMNSVIDLPDEYQHRDIVVSECTSDGTVLVQHFTTFSARRVLYENNKTTFPPAGNSLIYQAHFKDKTSEVTARFNECSGSTLSAYGCISFANQGAFHCKDQEACYNIFNISVGNAILWNGQNTVAGNTGIGQRIGAVRQYCYRNTLISRSGHSVLYIPRWSYMAGCEPVYLEDNIFVTDAANGLVGNGNTDAWSLIGVNDNVPLNSVDAGGLLTGPARMSKLGLEGAEIAYDD